MLLITHQLYCVNYYISAASYPTFCVVYHTSKAVTTHHLPLVLVITPLMPVYLMYDASYHKSNAS